MIVIGASLVLGYTAIVKSMFPPLTLRPLVIDGSHVRHQPKLMYRLLTLDYLGLHIMTNHSFGPQPHTTTYIVIWKIQISGVKAILSSLKARNLGTAGAAGFSILDGFRFESSDTRRKDLHQSQ